MERTLKKGFKTRGRYECFNKYHNLFLFLLLSLCFYTKMSQSSTNELITDKATIGTIKECQSMPLILSNQTENYIKQKEKHRHTNQNSSSIVHNHFHTSTPSCSLLEESQDVLLTYTIYQYSSYSLYYHPQNILEDKPRNQLSRWSSGTQDSQQYIIIKFDVPAIARKYPV